MCLRRHEVSHVREASLSWPAGRDVMRCGVVWCGGMG
jgi:hypothetical protein